MRKMATPNIKQYCWDKNLKALIAIDFFSLGFIKDRVFVPPIPNDFPKISIIFCILSNLLTELCEKLDFRLDEGRTAKGVHIQHL